MLPLDSRDEVTRRGEYGNRVFSQKSARICVAFFCDSNSFFYNREQIDSFYWLQYSPPAPRPAGILLALNPVRTNLPYSRKLYSLQRGEVSEVKSYLSLLLEIDMSKLVAVSPHEDEPSSDLEMYSIAVFIISLFAFSFIVIAALVHVKKRTSGLNLFVSFIEENEE